MQQSTLFHIKKAIKPFINLVKLYTRNDNFPILVTLRIELENICMRWEDCQGYTLDADLKKLDETMVFLSALKEVEKDFHFVVYIIEQVEMIVQGNEMTEMLDEEEASNDFYAMAK